MMELVNHIYRMDPRAVRLSSIGGAFDDPGLFLEPSGAGEAGLIDCGDLRRLPVAKAQKIGWLFLSHLHIDHLIGFDQLLRVRLFSPLPLRVFGPRGTVEAIAHRLQGYAWNLTSGSPFAIEAFDLDPKEGVLEGVRFRCHARFRRESPREVPLYRDDRGLALPTMDPGISLRILEVDHGVPCLAFFVEQRFPPKVRVEALQEWGAAPGPWLKELVAGALDSHEVAGLPRARGWLEEQFLSSSPPFRFAYLTDTRLSPALQRELVKALKGYDLLCSESAYLQRDRQLAEKNLHLTAHQVAELAVEAECRYLGLFHLSRRYAENGPLEHLEEARRWLPNSYLLCDLAPPFSSK